MISPDDQLGSIFSTTVMMWRPTPTTPGRPVLVGFGEHKPRWASPEPTKTGRVRRDVDSVVELTTRTLARAGAGKDVQIYLTGGSSRVPLVHQRLGELGTVATLDNPKTVVALGALEAIVSQEGGSATPAPGPAPVPVGFWGGPPARPLTPVPSNAPACGGPNTPPSARPPLRSS